MGTSATIIIKDEWDDKFFLNRGSDGFPDQILPDIKNVIELKKDSWSGSEIGSFVSSFIAINTNPDERLPNYALASNIRGDDSYQYYIFFNKELDKWECSYADIPYFEITNQKLNNQEPIICQKCFCEANYARPLEYHCKTCNNDLLIEEDYLEFKVNGEYSNIVFKEIDFT